MTYDLARKGFLQGYVNYTYNLIGFQILNQIDTVQSCFMNQILFETEESI